MLDFLHMKYVLQLSDIFELVNYDDVKFNLS